MTCGRDDCTLETLNKIEPVAFLYRRRRQRGPSGLILRFQPLFWSHWHPPSYRSFCFYGVWSLECIVGRRLTGEGPHLFSFGGVIVLAEVGSFSDIVVWQTSPFLFPMILQVSQINSLVHQSRFGWNHLYGLSLLPYLEWVVFCVSQGKVTSMKIVQNNEKKVSKFCLSDDKQTWPHLRS